MSPLYFFSDHPLNYAARGKLHPHARRVEIVHHRLADAGDRGVAEVVTGVEAVRVAGLGQELLGAGGIVRVAGRLPVELEAAGHDPEGDLRESEGVRLVDGLTVDGVIRGEAHAPVVPRRLGIPLLTLADGADSRRSAQCPQFFGTIKE